MKEKIVENKKDEMQEYMQQAAALIHSYVPPAPAQIQAVKDGGRLAANPQSGGKLRIEMKQYLKPGDSLTIDLDTAANRLLGLGVNSYLDKPDEPVTLAVQMNTLPDGALYSAQTTLDAKAKNITGGDHQLGPQAGGALRRVAGSHDTTGKFAMNSSRNSTRAVWRWPWP